MTTEQVLWKGTLDALLKYFADYYQVDTYGTHLKMTHTSGKVVLVPTEIKNGCAHTVDTLVATLSLVEQREEEMIRDEIYGYMAFTTS